MKTFICVGLVVILSTICLAGEKVNVPKGVVYKYASDELNARAKEKILKVFKENLKDEDVLKLFCDSLICGPDLWMEIKGDPKLSKITEGVALFRVPRFDEKGKIIRTDTFEGKLFQSEEEVLSFWNVLKSKYHFDRITIRKPNYKELQIYWSMISYDIEEPIFVVETKTACILVDFVKPVKSDLRILWIDNYQHVSLATH